MHSLHRQGALTGPLGFLILREQITMKILLGILALIILLGIGLLSLPFLVDLAAYQDQYKPLIENALNRKIELQGIRLTIWPRIGARVVGFTVMDDPSFSAGPFASLTSLDVGVKLLPLLSGQVDVEELTLRHPVITVIKNKDRITNLSTLGPRTAAPSTPAKPETQQGDPLQALALLAVDRLTIDGGTLVYRDLTNASNKEYEIRDLALTLTAVHLGEIPTLHLNATVLPYNVPVSLDGRFGPLMQTLELQQYDFTLAIGRMAVAIKGALVGGTLDATVSALSLDSTDLPMPLPLTKPVQVKDLRIVARAPYPLKQGVPPMELADVTELGLKIQTGGSAVDVKGTMLAGHAKVSATSALVNTADLPIDTGLKKPVELKNLDLNADLKGQDARLSNLSFVLFNGETKAQAGMSLGSSSPPFNGHVLIRDLQLKPALEALAPDSKLSMSGTAAADIAVAGRGFSRADLTRALEGPGHLEIKDGKIDGVNLTGEALALLKVAGVSLDQVNATAFSTLETDFMIRQGVLTLQKLLADSHDFQATGSGTIGFDQALNVAVNLNLSQALSQKIAGSSPVAKVALKDGRLRLPLTMTGTVQNPSYGLDTKAFTGKLQEQAQEKAKAAVEGLLQGTTKPSDLKKEGENLLKGLLGR
ncbi:MAG TPA: AsmA family protein [Nitrospira sp.]|jgi:AsmA protein|nr:AsmA family protein [Nitrospira sp.]